MQYATYNDEGVLYRSHVTELKYFIVMNLDKYKSNVDIDLIYNQCKLVSTSWWYG